MIFVQIASYRDPALVSTVLNLFETAKMPEKIRLVVAWQHDEFESIFPISTFGKFIDIPYTESLGVCWARSILQKEYNDEEYALQLDSHHKFQQNWDELLMEMFHECSKKSKWPILSTYLPHFDENRSLNELWTIKAEKFLDDGPLFFSPEKIEKPMKKPFPVPFLSGHFIFSHGHFCKNIKYDSELYFYGEESSMSARAFTYGYDIYCPNKIVAWHDYRREIRPNHWKDCINWNKMDAASTAKYRKLMGMEGNFKFPEIFGKKRTIKEYEKFSGVSFKNKKITHKKI